MNMRAQLLWVIQVLKLVFGAGREAHSHMKNK